MHQYLCMSVAHRQSVSEERWISKKYWTPLFTCTPMDIFSSKGNNKEILTAMRVMVVSIGSRGSHIPAMTPRRLRRGVIAGM